MFRRLRVLFLVLIIVLSSNAIFAEGYTPQVGETLEFKVILKSFLHAGNQTVRVVKKEVYNSKEVFAVHSQLETVGFAKALYKYAEIEDLLLDADGLFPRYTRRECHEGSKIRIEEVVFDYENSVAERTVTVDGAKSSSQIKLPGPVQDALSLQFYLRKEGFTSGENKVFFYGDGNIKEIAFTASLITNQALKLDCGTFSQYSQFSNEPSKITVLVDNDLHLPLIIKQVAGFGKVESKLVKYTN